LARACTQEGEWGARTELAPGAGDGGCADEVGGVVEAVEDAGGGVEAHPVEEVPAAALLRVHGRRERSWVAVESVQILGGGGGGMKTRRRRGRGNRPSFGCPWRGGRAKPNGHCCSNGFLFCFLSFHR
jgi:hypothetical protein